MATATIKQAAAAAKGGTKQPTNDQLHAQCQAALTAFVEARTTLVKLREETNNQHWALLDQVNSALELSL